MRDILFSLTAYNKNEYQRLLSSDFENATVESVFAQLNPLKINWININSIGNKELVHKVGEHFDIHELIIEDILNTNQMPKLEDFNQQVFLVFKMLHYNPVIEEVEEEHLCIILSRTYLITFQENGLFDFETVTKKLELNQGNARTKNTDYLFYLLVDLVVDNYFLVLEKLREKIEELEDRVIDNPDKNMAPHIHKLKKQLNVLRKSIHPLTEVVSVLKNIGVSLVNKHNQIYFSDIYDHVTNLNSTIESFREMLSSLIEMNMTNISNSMNKVMKTLTIFSAIFLPLTFIAGIYGMNYQKMYPILEWDYGFHFIIGFMIFTVIIMLAYMKRKNWF